MISFDEKTGVFQLDTENSSYLMRIINHGILTTLYYGKKVHGDMTYITRYTGHSFAPMPEEAEVCEWVSFEAFDIECPTFGVGDYREHMLEVEDKDGITATDVRYKSHKIYKGKKPVPGLPSAYSDGNNNDVLEITLADSHTGIEATLIYSVFEECDAIVKSIKVKNTSKDTLMLRRCLSSAIGFEDASFDVMTLKGVYAMERDVKITPLISGKQVISSTRGASSHGLNPYIGLLRPNTTEHNGDAYGTAFIYSGNYLGSVEIDNHSRCRLVMGINPVDFSWELLPNAEFDAPEVCHVFSANGISGMSQCFHDFTNKHITRGVWRDKKRPLLINNWEATYFDFDGKKLIDIAKTAKDLGIEMLVLDDGWFGARCNDTAGLGDWVPNEEKLQMPLKKLAEEINKLGLRFGLWFEPEMINRNSNLFREHPEYVMHIEGRGMSHSRNQYVLNFANPEVVENIYNQMAKLLKEVNIGYIKWDFNRNLSEVSFPALGKNRQGEVFHRYMLGLYGLLERLTTEFPDILFESCSGGGGRCDLGILCYMQQNWASDNTDAIHRLRIQHGTSIVYPVRSIGSHYSVVPNHGSGRTTSVRLRAEVARFGTNGYELDLTQMSEEDKKQIKEINKEYHQLYNLVNFGDLYRLMNIFESNFSAWMFVSKDKSEALVEYVEVLGQLTGTVPPMKLVGLDENKTYIDEYTGQKYTGSVLMNVGVLRGGIRDFGLWRWHFTEVCD